MYCSFFCVYIPVLLQMSYLLWRSKSEEQDARSKKRLKNIPPEMRMTVAVGRRCWSGEDGFSLKQVPGAFTSLPRVMRLVWSTHAFFTLVMGFLSLIQGITPVISVWITSQVIDSVVKAALTRNVGLIWLPIAFQLGITLFSSLLSTLSNVTQQLLQELVSNRIQLMVLEKADTLDLSFFENPEFYDKLRQATDQSTYQPVSMISQTFDLCRTLVTLFSMIALLWPCLFPLFSPVRATDGVVISASAANRRSVASWLTLSM
jgi:ABC-type multidrug transport system fused ATPase/permease subunit